MVSPQAQTVLRKQIDLIGAVPRSEIEQHFAWADVFLLPSVCEGSATVTYEALHWGLPVICTSNTGSVVRDGQEGFIIPAGDAQAIADRIDQLRRDPELLAAMSSLQRGTIWAALAASAVTFTHRLQ
jgi:glycosyltransferase involved in cell wall biosynthesis